MPMGREGVCWVDERGIRSMCSTYDGSAELRGYFFLGCPPPFILEAIAVMILLEKVRSVNVLGWFPGVIAFGVPFPLHKVLEHSRLPMTSVVDQVFNLVFFSPLDQVRWRLREIGAVDGIFLVWQEGGRVEHIVGGP